MYSAYDRHHVSIRFHSCSQAHHADAPVDKAACIATTMQRREELPAHALPIKHLTAASQRELLGLAWEKRYGGQKVAHWVTTARGAFLEKHG